YIPPVAFLNFVLAGTILWTIYKFRKNKEILFLGILFTVVLFLMKGNNQPFGELFQFVFEKSTYLQVFRNPFEKFSFLLPLAAAPIFAFGIHSVQHSFNNKSIRKGILVGSYLFVLG